MKFAFVFPGQGSQSVGMMRGYGDMSSIRSTFDEASSHLGMDLWSLATEGPEEVLSMTTNTQPLMLTAGIAVYRAWLASGGAVPAMLAGHSLGEYTALVAAESLSFADALALTRRRAQLMQDEVPPGEGGMAAILGLADDDVRLACEEAAQGQILEPANFNSPGQVVIAGHRTAIDRGIEAAKARGAKRAVLLPMSIPSHCSLMRPAATKLAEYLASVDIKASVIPVVHNATVGVASSPEAIRHALVEQLYHPVKWVSVLQVFAQGGVDTIIECGPGKVLTPLVKRSVPGMNGVSMSDEASMPAIMEALR